MIDFGDMEDWEGFTKIIEILKLRFSALVLEKNDGPDSRIWYLEIDGLPLSLHHNPYGNYLKAVSEKSKSYLRTQLEKYKLVFY